MLPFSSSAEALALDLDLFVGIGNSRRIRILRSRRPKFAVNSGSHTTRRLKGEAGNNIALPLIREHRSIQSKGDKGSFHPEFAGDATAITGLTCWHGPDFFSSTDTPRRSALTRTSRWSGCYRIEGRSVT